MSSVLIFCNDLDYFLRHRVPVADKLRSLSYDVTVVTGGRKAPEAKKAGVAYVHMPIDRFSFRPVADLGMLLRSLFHIRSIRPKAVHLITLKPAIFVGLAAIAARSMGFGPSRIVITIPGLGRLMSPSAAGRNRAIDLTRALVKKAIKFIAQRREVYFTFESKHDRDLWVDDGLISIKNSLVISGAGVDPERFYPRTEQRTDRPLRVLFASRLLKSKGLDAFLLAAEQVVAHHPDIEFVVAGMVETNDPDGYPPEELSMKRQISFRGEVTDMPALLRDSDIVCLPTLYGEGIPRILIEAAASGVPAIATNIPGCREIVSHEDTGFLINIASIEEVAQEIANAVEKYHSDPDLLSRHGKATQAYFKSHDFSEASVVGSFVGLLCSEAI